MVNQSIRLPAVANRFYPGDPAELQRMLGEYLDLPVPVDEAPPKAIIAPHAGYVFSGAVAGSAYARLKPLRDTVKRVILLGPSHRVGFHGIAACSADYYYTPLGNVSLDRPSLDSIEHLPQVQVIDQAHQFEHSLEVHVPFLQNVLQQFRLVPLVVGTAEPQEVAEVLEILWGGAETLIVISSDLSHYHDYATAQALDSAASDAIANLRYEDLSDEQACGLKPVKGLLYLARQRGMCGKTVGLRNSGDTAGDKARVVGYGSYIFTAADAAPPTTDKRRILLDVARRSIEHGLESGKPLPVKLADYPDELRRAGASFVTLNKADGSLRGCIGTLQAYRPLIEDVAQHAFASAFQDHRFAPLKQEELTDLQIHISILSASTPLQFQDEADLIRQLRPGVDGLILSDGAQRGTFLPSVWDSLPDAGDFWRHLKRKAGLPMEYWSDTLTVSRYTVEYLE